MSTDANERTPLINGSHRRSAWQVLKAEDEPGWLASFRWFIFGSWLNILLLVVPLSVCAHFLNWDAAWRFSLSFVAIIPLAKLLGDATEQMSLSLGQTLAGLLNATFGNAVEIIVGITALLQGEIRIVQTSMLGSVLSNILLVLGCSFLAGGLKYNESEFQVTAAQTNASLMTLACITLVIPAAYHSSRMILPIGPDPTPITPGIVHTTMDKNPLMIDVDPDSQRGLLIISRGTALLLLGVYVAYLFFQLKTHARLFKPLNTRRTANGDLEGTACADPPTSSAPAAAAVAAEDPPEMSIVAAGTALLLVTVITSFIADFLVASIEETADRYHIPKPFIGLILLPIVANAAEHVTSVWMAMKDKMELTIGICVGSSIQIATFVVPLLVVVGWISGHELTLYFANFETVSFFVSVLLVNLLIQDGKSNYMEGLLLITLYLIIALAFWVS